MNDLEAEFEMRYLADPTQFEDKDASSVRSRSRSASAELMREKKLTAAERTGA